MIRAEAVTDAPEGATRHIYPASAMVGDYLRAAAGLVPTGVLFATVPFGMVAAGILGGFAAIFGIFGLRTVVRHGTTLDVSDTALRASGMRQRLIPWAELDRLKLAYYSTRRDRRTGWMQLELGAGRTRISLDSRIEGFDQLVKQAAAVAHARGLELSEATIANLRALGIRSEEFGAPHG
ncbi:MAG TPA: hypothetical protein VHW90_00285 [Stellaceae bacterium]|jgi:hypothetical protein|nr:hypothetical protein [Stellaceae bacterium]